MTEKKATTGEVGRAGKRNKLAVHPNDGAIKGNEVKVKKTAKKDSGEKVKSERGTQTTRKFNVKMRFNNEILGSKPLDPSVFLIHRIESTRKAIFDWAKKNSKNKKIMTFLDASQITNEEVQQNLRSLRNTIEEYYAIVFPMWPGKMPWPTT